MYSLLFSIIVRFFFNKPDKKILGCLVGLKNSSFKLISLRTSIKSHFNSRKQVAGMVVNARSHSW